MTTYCTECKYFEKRTLKAEVPFCSDKYIESGVYYRCNKFGRYWSNISEKDVEFLFCKDADWETNTD